MSNRLPSLVLPPNTVVGNISSGDAQAAAITLDELAALTFATPPGANLVGYLPAGTGAVATTVQAKLRESVSIADFLPVGYVTDGSVDYSTEVQAAIDTGKTVDLVGLWLGVNNLTHSTNYIGLVSSKGIARLIKNANGPILTSTGTEFFMENVIWRGDASSPTFTGDGVVSSGSNPVFKTCGGRWISGVPLKCTGGHVQILGCGDIYQTTDATANGYDIEIGVSGTNTNYHQVIGYYSSQTTGGIKFIDCGSQSVQGGQFGKYTIASGTSPAGVNGGMVQGARILGAIDVNISSAVFTGNQIGAVSITFAGGTSGHLLDASNTLAVGYSITNNSVNSVIVKHAQIPFQSYTPAWTGAVTDPVIGNGILTGKYSKNGQWVDVSVYLQCGSTTTYGSGDWAISLPFIPSTSLFQNGVVKIGDSGTANILGIATTSAGGVAKFTMVTDNAGNGVRSNVPMTWTTSDNLSVTLRYQTDE